MPAVQLNTRIDSEIKRQGDAVFARVGLTPSNVVRAVWTYAANTQTIPEVLFPSVREDNDQALEAIRSGAGLVQRYLGQAGLQYDMTPFDYGATQDELYDELEEEVYVQLASS